MSSTFPSIIATLTNPLATDRLNSPSHSGIETAQNVEIIQIENIIGVEGASSVVGTLEYFLKSPASSGGGHIQTANKGGTGQTTFTKGDMIVATSASVLSKLAIGTDGQVLTADSLQSAGVRWGSGKFGGTGADGALTLTSGTTTINLASVLVATKNYSSISITGSAALNFVSPNSAGTVTILKSTGNVTVTSSATPAIDASGIGAIGGGLQTYSAGNNTLAGSSGTDGKWGAYKAGKGNGATNGPAIGGAGSIIGFSYNTTQQEVFNRYPIAFIGAGGGNGGITVAGGAGTLTYGPAGRGGGCLIIECAGALNFTTGSISVGGGNGANGTGTGYSDAAAGGSGGGSGGFLGVFYNSLTANTGSSVLAGGTGGNSKTIAARTAYGGGGAGATTAGNDGTSSTSDGAKTGGDGAYGLGLIVPNTEY